MKYLATPAALTVRNTLDLPCRAERGMVAGSEAQLIAALRRHPQELLVLGDGSNVILPERLTRPLCFAAFRGIEIRHRRGHALLTAAAGENWHALVRHSLDQGLAGLENLALIPGSAGAAPAQNIGAYGLELAERLVAVRALDRRSGAIAELDPGDCAFGYRSSIFKRKPERYAVLALTLRLERRWQPRLDYPDVYRELERLGWRRPSPRQVAQVIVRIRRRKLPDPRQWGNAGSFFQNPIVAPEQAEQLRRREPGLIMHQADSGTKLAAAQLIDLCGWKGRRMGDAGVWRQQPLVLVNHGRARRGDFLALAEAIRASVQARFQVALELEPTLID